MNAPLARDRRYVSFLLLALFCVIAHDTVTKTREGWIRRPLAATVPSPTVPRIKRTGLARRPNVCCIRPSFPRCSTPVPATFCTANVKAYLRRVARTGWPFVTPGLFHFDAVST